MSNENDHEHELNHKREYHFILSLVDGVVDTV